MKCCHTVVVFSLSLSPVSLIPSFTVVLLFFQKNYIFDCDCIAEIVGWTHREKYSCGKDGNIWQIAKILRQFFCWRFNLAASIDFLSFCVPYRWSRRTHGVSEKRDFNFHCCISLMCEAVAIKQHLIWKLSRKPGGFYHLALCLEKW